MIRPIICDWDAASTRPGTSGNSSIWKSLLHAVGGIEEPVFLNRRLGELIPTVLEASVGAALARGEQPLMLGGDHRLTYSVLKVVPHHTPAPFDVHQFDAHHDAHPAGSLSNFSFMYFVQHRLRQNVVRHGCRETDAVPNGDPRHQASYITVDVDYFDPEFFDCVTYPLPVPDDMECDLQTLRRDITGIAARGPVLGCDIVEWQAGSATPEQFEVVRQVLGIMLDVMTIPTRS